MLKSCPRPSEQESVDGDQPLRFHDFPVRVKLTTVALSTKYPRLLIGDSNQKLRCRVRLPLQRLSHQGRVRRGGARPEMQRVLSSAPASGPVPPLPTWHASVLFLLGVPSARTPSHPDPCHPSPPIPETSLRARLQFRLGAVTRQQPRCWDTCWALFPLQEEQ